MASDTEIVNQALLDLGADRISDLDDASDRATACRTIYGLTRDALLEEHPWNFAIRRQALTALSDAATAAALPYGFSSAHQLPADPYCLRVLDTTLDETWEEPLWAWWGTRASTPLWQIEGRVLISNDAAVSARYIARIENPGTWSTVFVRALWMQLAARLAGPLRQSATEVELREKLAARALARAKTLDSMEGRYRARRAVDLLIVR